MHHAYDPPNLFVARKLATIRAIGRLLRVEPETLFVEAVPRHPNRDRPPLLTQSVLSPQFPETEYRGERRGRGHDVPRSLSGPIPAFEPQPDKVQRYQK